ncbi:MAG: TVP38/TMEM64 family protein [Acetobacteraceae bacterium]|nr:TVP38/TMEM64 family protein [Acetobacteraceae bacterium]
MRHLAWAWPLLLLAAALLLAWALGLPQLLASGALPSWLRAGQAYAAIHPFLAALAYVTLYTALVAASVPTGTALTVSGGALFGPALGTALAVAGATAGAILLFLAARSTLGAVLARRHAALLARVQPRLERDGFAGLLALRLVPIVPFWLVNLAAGILRMRLLPFALATGLGIIPATAVFASAGAGFAGALAAGTPPGPSLLLRPGILLPLLGLAVLSILPMLVRQARRG